MPMYNMARVIGVESHYVRRVGMTSVRCIVLYVRGVR